MDSLAFLFSPKLETASFTDRGCRLGVEMSEIAQIIRLPALRNLTVVLRNGAAIADVPHSPLQRWPLESLDVQIPDSGAVIDITCLDTLLSKMKALQSFGMKRPEVT